MSPSIVVLAGRRIDAEGADSARFPLTRLQPVSEAIEKVFIENEVAELVCSAACGADLLALEIADRLQILTTIILPFDSHRFIETSVVDRPGDWEGIFEAAVKNAAAAGRLLILDGEDEQEGYERANSELLKEAQGLAERSGHSDLFSLVVWDGKSRSADDLTSGFKKLCEDNGLRVVQISTV